MENTKAPKRIREVPQMRDLFSKKYLNDDGSYTAEISSSIIHYLDENNQHQAVSTELFDEDDFDLIDFPVTKAKKASFKAKKEITKGLKEKGGKLSRDDSDFHGLKVPFDVTIPKKFKKGYSVGRGADRLTFKPEGATNAKGERIGSDAIKYPGVWDQVDVILELKENRLKETIILMDPAAPSIFTFEVTGQLEDDLSAGSLSLEPAWLIDANGERRDVQQKIRKQGAKTFLDVVADVYGLAYPIEIDPTVGFTENQNELYVSRASSSVWPPNTTTTLSSGGGQILVEKTRTGPSTFTRRVGLTGFSTASIPANATITAASITLGINQVVNGNDFYFEAYWYTGALDTTAYSEPPGFGSLQAYAALYTDWVNGGSYTLNLVGANTNIQKGGQTNLRLFIGGTDTPTFTNSVSINPNHTMSVTYNLPPNAPTVTAPNGGESINTNFLITWTAGSDSDTATGALQYNIELSTNGGSTWSTIVALTAAGATSYSHNFVSVPETTTAKIRIRTYDGSLYSAWDESNATFTIKHNTGPSKPTNTSPAGTSGAPGVVNTLTPTLSWTFNDPDAGDSQASRQILVYDAAGVLKHDSGTSAGAGQTYTIPGGILAWKNKYYWRVRTTDAAGVTSVYSDDQWFLTNQGPVGTITNPSGTSGWGTVFNDTLQPTFTWTYSDPDGDQQAAVQILVKDGAATVFDSGEIVTTGLTYQIPLAAGLIYDKTYTTQIRAKDVNGTWGAYSALKYFHLNRSPGAPTGMSPAGTTGSPQIIQDNLQPRLSWVFNDSDATDTQVAYKISIWDAEGSLVHDPSFVGSSLNYYDVPAGVLISGKKYYWKVSTADSHNKWHLTYSNEFISQASYFYTNAKPNTPINPSPAGGSAASPATVADDLTPTLSWQFSDQNGGDVQAAFEIHLYNEAGTLLLDTGEIVSAAQTYEIPLAYRLSYSEKYQWEVRTKDQYEAWSNFTSRGWFTPKVGTPSGISATADNFGAKIIVDWSDSASEGLQGYNVYRATAAGGPYTKINGALITGSVYNDSNVSTGTTYFYKVEAYVTATEISPLSAAASAVAVFSAWYLGSFKFIGPTSFGGKRSRIQSKRSVLGKKKRVIQDRGFAGEELDLTLFLADDEYSTGKKKFDDLMAELEKTQEISVRDPFGQVWKCAPGGVDWNLVPGSGTLTYTVSLPLEEVN